MSGLRILHLYPRELGINGDAGNVATLVRRLEWRGLDSEILTRGIGDAMPTSVDLVHIGTGQAAAQRSVHPDLLMIAGALRDYSAEGVPFVAITAGWQLLGQELELADGTALEGVGIFPSRARLVNDRVIGEITGKGSDGSLVAGFENHGAVTSIFGGVPSLMTVAKGFGNACRDSVAGDRVDGVRDGANIGTNLHGPFLPMNPRFADELLTVALARKDVELPPADSRIIAVDELAKKARDAIVGRVGR